MNFLRAKAGTEADIGEPLGSPLGFPTPHNSGGPGCGMHSPDRAAWTPPLGVHSAPHPQPLQLPACTSSETVPRGACGLQGCAVSRRELGASRDDRPHRATESSLCCWQQEGGLVRNEIRKKRGKKGMCQLLWLGASPPGD